MAAIGMDAALVPGSVVIKVDKGLVFVVKVETDSVIGTDVEEEPAEVPGMCVARMGDEVLWVLVSMDAIVGTVVEVVMTLDGYMFEEVTPGVLCGVVGVGVVTIVVVVSGVEKVGKEAVFKVAMVEMLVGVVIAVVAVGPVLVEGLEKSKGAVPAYLLDREGQSRAKVLSNMIKQKRKEKAGKWEVPLPKVHAQGETEVLKVIRTGKRKKKAWKRMVTKVCFVGDGFTRKPPKYERFIRPMGLRFKKAHVTHPELKATFCLPILGVKKNPLSPLYTTLGVITKGTVIEVNVSELGLVTQGGKVIWGKYAQVTNNPENDGCINAVLLV
ncbi:ribosome biogenesis protein NSA2 homolog [Vulpes vulpes]|uniref:Ribosome biogenesis protein NSA2 homolog n=1 Tax=Vulpes vulpes TaxID=9627 RepID=A0ABM4ZXV9_VULVU